jgi:two-component system chemotaxis response regulator CheY
LSKALVVDDSRAARMILGRNLREFGYEVDEAADGKAALGILEKDPGQFQLVLVDWNMPVMNGLELVEALRARPEFSSVLIVMVTTETELGRLATALTAGLDEYVMKPFTKDILLSKLEIAGAIASSATA